MKVLIIFALALATASAEKVKTRNLLVPAGRPEGRITKGYEATEGQIPYQVGLCTKTANGKSYWCGGTLLNHENVLTAAHCLDNTVEGTVYMGSIKPENAEVERKFTSSDFIVHDEWNSASMKNDIGIIKIDHTEYSDNIQPVKLPSTRTSYSSLSGELAIASGWGYTHSFDTERPKSLLYGYMHVKDLRECMNAGETQLCASTENNAICHGDSGGPLVLRSTKELIGITSFTPGGGSCEENKPPVFTRVTQYSDWIKNNAGL